MRKLVTFAFGLALMLTQSGTAAAEGSEATVTGPTGPNSTNTATVNQTVDINIDISNTAKVNYNFDLDLNTGGNTASHNTTVGDLASGNIGGDLNLKTEITQSGVDCNCLSDPGSSVAKVSGPTGPNSTNSSTVNLTQNTNVKVDNKADVDYSFKIVANTGGNTVSHNTTAGDLRSGDIRFGLDIETIITQGEPGEEPTVPPAPGPGAGPLPGVPPGPEQVAYAPGVPPSAAPAVAAAVLFPAGSSLLILLLGLILAANFHYIVSRRKFPFAIHLNGEGKVGKS
jgi:acid phosphatase family membrane protein YuiD